MRNVFRLVAMLGVLGLSGCGLWRKGEPAEASDRPPTRIMTARVIGDPVPDQKPTDQKLIVTPDDGLNGKVVRAEANLQFVVLNFPIGQMPSIGQRLNVYRRGLKAGELKVSGPRQDDNIVADIVIGDAAVGDEVRDK